MLSAGCSTPCPPPVVFTCPPTPFDVIDSASIESIDWRIHEYDPFCERLENVADALAD